MALTAEERKARRAERKARKAELNGTEPSVRSTVKLEDLEPLEKVSQPVRMPAEMKILLQSAAADAGESATTWARNVLAAELGYEVPAEFGKTERVRVGPSADKAAAKKAKAAGRRATIRQLLEKYKAGEITIDEDAVAAEVATKLAEAEADDEDDEEEDD